MQKMSKEGGLVHVIWMGEMQNEFVYKGERHVILANKDCVVISLECVPLKSPLQDVVDVISEEVHFGKKKLN